MKDIRLLGDLVRIKLKESGIPVQAYIFIENLAVLAIAAHLPFFLPFSDLPQSFLPLTVCLIGVIYGFKSGTIGVIGYLVLGYAGLPFFAEGNAAFWGNTGFLLAYLPAVFLAALLANFEWDRDFRKSAYLLFLSQIVIVTGGISWIKFYQHSLEPLGNLFIDFLPGLLFSTLIGAIMLKIIWEAVLHLHTNNESAQQ
jgi:biotin transport system substrate-specific component